MIDYFERKIRLKDFEVWDIRISDQHYTLAILDEFRPATLDDFENPYLIYEEDDQRANYVSATYFLMNLLKMNIEKYWVNLHNAYRTLSIGTL